MEASRNGDATIAQMQQAITSAQHFITLLVQGWAALIATDAVLLGYGVSQRQAWVLLVSAMIPSAMVYVSVAIFKQCLPLAVVGLRMEHALLPSGDGIVSLYLQGRMPSIYRDILALAEIEDDSARAEALAKYGRRRIWLPPNPGLGPAIVGFAVLGQLVFFALSVTVFDYRFM